VPKRDLPYIPDPHTKWEKFLWWATDHPRWILGGIGFGVVGVVVLGEWAPTHTDSFGDQEQYGVTTLFIWIFLLLAVLSLYLGYKYLRGPLVPSEAVFRSQRIERLNDALGEAMQTIEGIRAEVEENEHLLRRLQQQKEIDEELANLNESEARAVNAAIAVALRNDRRRGIPLTVLVNLGCGLVGIVVGHFLF
jgi:ABC-type multidrug transport system fused ATPase/permease subunit